ncbi:cysteinyl leukotriene receptor 2 [Sardina pilchardus]|uniref:cysteinyl leukotriene receptor 2 n=1 Tax=Sardina pilchardus TaxID=27697 RepID=UPI002E119F65
MNQSCIGDGQNCSISEFKRNVYPTAYLLMFIIGLIANLISLYVFLNMWRAERTLSSINLFMVNLTVSDLMLICSLPFRASYYINDSNWVFGDVTCRFMSYIFYVNMYGSVYFLMVLSVIRYVAITKPYTYVRQQHYRFTWLVCVCIWLLVSLASIPNLFGGSKQDGEKVKCLELVEPEATLLNTIVIMNYGALLLGFLVPFLVILVCYIFVVHRLLKQNIMKTQRHQYKKSCSLVIIVLVIFLACFLPYHVARSVFLHAEWDLCTNGTRGSCGYIIGVRKAAVITHCLASANSCLDPLLYIFVGENFRKFWRIKSQRQKQKQKHNSTQRDSVNVANAKTEMQLLSTQ